jgi:predicted flap endonuclease-1-like 5' DNA nuclease
MSFTLDSAQTALIIVGVVAFLIGLLVARMLSPARRRVTVLDAELARHRAEIDARDARIRELEREVASSRDQIRPLSDEVDRLRRQIASRREPPAAVTPAPVDPAPTLSTPGLPPAPEPVVPAAAPAAAPAAPFLDAPAGAPDDLTLLKGVGAKLAAKLNEIGVFHIAQIAAWTPEEARIADAKLDPFRGRIERDQLIEQARLLAAGRTTEYEARFGKIGQ